MVGDGNWARAGEEFEGGIDAKSGVNCGMEVGDGDGGFDDLFAEFVGHAVGTLMYQATAREQQAEATALVSSTAATIVHSGPAEFGADRDECFVEDPLMLEVSNESRQCDIEFLDQQVLILLAFL